MARLLGTAALAISGVAVGAVSIDQLLAESELELTPPANAVSVSPAYDPTLSYEAAYQSRDGLLQIRYAIRPIGRIEIDYEDPHNAAPDPNHIFPLMFQSLVSGLAERGKRPSREFPPDQALSTFNADWAAAATFDVKQTFGGAYSQALMIAMHRNRKADAYVVFLYNDYESVRKQVQENLGSLRFTPTGKSL